MMAKTNKSLSRLHFITPPGGSVKEVEAVTIQACRGGVRWVQLRLKGKTQAAWRRYAEVVRAVCRQHEACFIVNDNVAIAQAIDADGVHLGKDDMPPLEARKKLGPDAIIGGTANTFADVIQVAKAGVDYIGLGPFRHTHTKEKLSPLLGLDGTRHIVQQSRKAGVKLPIIAIGGILAADIRMLMRCGVHGVAVAAAIGAVRDPEQAAFKFVTELKSTLSEHATA